MWNMYEQESDIIIKKRKHRFTELLDGNRRSQLLSDKSILAKKLNTLFRSIVADKWYTFLFTIFFH